ncbi:alpha/beta hydrolase [Oceanibacterium hippocampi]|uniref:Carboxylesterase NlhH n=1 Tax=Oceanibacterium hippocampi TaxID=745714 RepID=A0A1Y5RMU8_9PROT|nr:alpha/beta hydrolase [Oceanibacterium hippocampi]SLN20189.1 Carboxylesterase NlhH [Oceanibacterium hippocampi]
MALYGEYDREGLDGQYFLRPRVPDFQTFFDGYARKSALTRERLPGKLDIPYGPRPGEKLDIFTAGDGPAPVHVFIHGGYWQSMDKSDFDYVADGLVPAGVTTVVVNYDLAPLVGVGEIVRQVRAALIWVWQNIAGFGGDPARITVSGHSAGGHLTAMVCATDWSRLDPDLPADLVKAGTSISGIYDLEPIRLCYLNEKLGLDAAAAAENSPLHLASHGNAPLIVTTGGLETDEYHRQQAEFVRVWRAAGRRVDILEMPGYHHFSVIDELARPDSLLNRAVIGQISA